MTAVLLSRDLMTTSQSSGAAARASVPLVSVANIEQLEARCLAEVVPLVILDLSLPGLVPQDVVARLRALATPPEQIIAFGPHVHSDRLAAAREAGCDEVLSRGQYHAQCEELLGRIA
ncbi:MAG: hypothetical protein K8T25_18260 [Planctomycetia bacterium]|nr:hypothetical protein [Planctomycetia bacterium]